MSRSGWMCAFALASVVAAGALAGDAKPSAKERVAKQIAVLRSEAPLEQKHEACRQLAQVGDAGAVPALAGLLSDAKLSHMARYALEPMPDAAAGKALRDSLGSLKGELLTGVIHSIGIREDGPAVGALSRLARGPDAAVAAGVGLLAAVVALTRGRRDRLHVDRMLGRGTVTCKKQTTELAFDQVRSWALCPSLEKRTTEKSGRRTNVIHAPELALLTADEKQVKLHTFGAGQGAWRIAARAVEGLAELTGKPFEIVTASPDEAQDGPQSLGEAVGMLGERVSGDENADNPD